MKGLASSVVTFVSDSTVKRITEMAFWRANKKDMAPFQDIHLEESVKNLHYPEIINVTAMTSFHGT